MYPQGKFQSARHLSRYIVKRVNLKENKRNFKTSISYIDCEHCDSFRFTVQHFKTYLSLPHSLFLDFLLYTNAIVYKCHFSIKLQKYGKVIEICKNYTLTEVSAEKKESNKILKNCSIILASGSRDEFTAHLHNNFKKNGTFKVFYSTV